MSWKHSDATQISIHSSFKFSHFRTVARSYFYHIALFTGHSNEVYTPAEPDDSRRTMRGFSYTDVSAFQRLLLSNQPDVSNCLVNKYSHETHTTKWDSRLVNLDTQP